jgi:hypothetical protein
MIVPDSVASDVAAECRRIDLKFQVIGIVAMVLFASVVLSCRFLIGLSASGTMAVSATVAYILGIGWATMFLAPNMKRADISIRMGARTVSYISELHDEVKPIASDVRKTVTDVVALVDRFKHEDYDKIQKRWNALVEDGTVERAIKAFEALPSKIDELVAALPRSTVGTTPEDAEAEFVRRRST